MLIKGGKNIFIGDDFHIGKDFLLAVYGVKGKIVIGNNVNCQHRVRISSYEGVQIGNNVLMGSDILIIDNNHAINPNGQYIHDGEIISKPVVIGDGCWIAEKCIILPGVTIGENSVIGAGSVVTKDVPPYSIAVGNPAKVVKTYDREEKCWKKVI